MQAGKQVEVSTVKVSVWWPAIAYIVLTFGEVLVYSRRFDLRVSAEQVWIDTARRSMAHAA